MGLFAKIMGKLGRLEPDPDPALAPVATSTDAAADAPPNTHIDVVVVGRVARREELSEAEWTDLNRRLVEALRRSTALLRHDKSWRPVWAAPRS